MTDGEFGRTPWWEFDPEEVPVPSESLRWEAPDDAELIVNAQRQAILREDTEPSAMTIPTVEVPQDGGSRISASPSSRAAGIAAIVLLLLACGAAFLAGWDEGAAKAATTHGPAALISNGSWLGVATDTSENSSQFRMRGSSAGSKARDATEGGGR